MPGMDGYEATHKIREWERQSGSVPVPIIALTAHATSEQKARCLATGMNAHIAKPFRRETLLNVIRQSMEELRDAL